MCKKKKNSNNSLNQRERGLLGMKKLKNSNGALPKRRKSKKKIAIALLLLAGIAFGAKSYMGGNDKNIISASEVGNLALEI